MSINLEQVKEQWDSLGAEYLGSIAQLNVNVPTAQPVRLVDLVARLSQEEAIPNDWLPEVEDMTSLYLQTISKLGKMTIKKFIMPTDCAFDRDKHKSYSVKTLQRDRNAENGVIFVHQIYQETKDNKEIKDDRVDVGTLEASLFENSLEITLIRTSGNRDTDAAGTSTFEIHIVDSEGSNEIPCEFKPFVATLTQMWQDKVNGYYTTDQIRKLVFDIIKDRLDADNVVRGTYFISSDKHPSLNALSTALKEVHPGINLWHFPVVKFSDPNQQALNQSLSNVQQQLSSSLMTDIKDLLSDLQALKTKSDEAGSDSGKRGVRDSTWQSRADDLRKLRQKINDYRDRELLVNDILDDTILECAHILREKLL